MILSLSLTNLKEPKVLHLVDGPTALCLVPSNIPAQVATDNTWAPQSLLVRGHLNRQ
jgi:hypothetical protein